MNKFLLISLMILLSFSLSMAQTFVGSAACSTCHNSVNSNLGYNIITEYNLTGHPYKLNEVNGAPPVYPANTSPGVPLPPAATGWSDFSYVIGGYGWKSRYVQTDGRIFTADSMNQYNHQTQSWVPYHYLEDKKYDYGCFPCHTTGPSPVGSWNGVPADSLGTFSETGIRCEGCHGPSSLHVGSPMSVAPPITGDSLTYTQCGECHQRGGKTNAIPASGGYVKHHEQFNEMKASKHGDGLNMDLTCGTCHDTHIALRYPDATMESAITTNCEDCHTNKTVLVNGTPKSIDCEDCHMSLSAKSAVGTTVGNGFYGDIPNHIWKINTDAVTRDSMFTSGGSAVKLDDDGLAAVTLDFACLACHSNENVAWAAGYADDIHTNGITTSIDDITIVTPTDFTLSQNYPNPFNPTSAIDYTLPNTSSVKIVVYNVLGQEMFTIFDGKQPAGSYTAKFSAEGIPSGMYLYKIDTNLGSITKKMLVTK